MNLPRRYDGDEIDEILRRAVTRRDDPDAPGSGSDGLTLAELQDVGRQAGIAPERIAEAARSLEHSGEVQSSLGLPLKVSHSTSLPRAVTELEWEALLADLRATFHATGAVHREGGLRGWTNGNLHVWIEPDGGGHRLRMGSRKASAQRLLGAGVGMLGLSGALALLGTIVGSYDVAATAFLAIGGLGALGAGTVQLPSWARTRLGQMDEVAGRLVGRMGADEPDPEV